MKDLKCKICFLVKDVLELWSKASIPRTALKKTTSVPKGQWLGALKKAKSKEDPWESFNIIGKIFCWSDKRDR